MKIRLFNICLIIVATISLWLTNTLTENKIVLSILFGLCLGFWIVAKKDCKETDEKKKAIKEILERM